MLGDRVVGRGGQQGGGEASMGRFKGHSIAVKLEWYCVAVCCSVLQCVAVCCSVLQCAAVCCSVVQCGAVC